MYRQLKGGDARSEVVLHDCWNGRKTMFGEHLLGSRSGDVQTRYCRLKHGVAMVDVILPDC